MIEFEFDAPIKNCITCGSSNIKENLTDHRGISITVCNECGFQFMNPQYTDNYLSEYYSTYMEDEDFDHWHEALTYCHDFYLSLIEKYTKLGSLLDIGCGNGHLLEIGINRGWSVHGL